MKFDKFIKNLLCKNLGNRDSHTLRYKEIIINIVLVLDFGKSAWSVYKFVLHYEQEF